MGDERRMTSFMNKPSRAPRTVDEYIAGFPGDVQMTLKKIRETIRKAAPAAEVTISYRIPAFRLHGMLIFFAAYPHHIGLYPAPRSSRRNCRLTKGQGDGSVSAG